jgi:hypothetical protein
MRKSFLAFALAIAALPITLWAGTLKIIPTTTLQAQTSNNTSAANSFKAQTNGNLGAGNVSKVDIHSLLYPGATTKVIAHLMPWWGDPRHINVGYNSHDPAQIHNQITDMISRGVDGVIIDWYGDKDYTDQTAKLVMAEAEQHPGFTFAIMIDKGAIALSPCSGCNSQQSLIHLVQYVEQTYIPSAAYMRVNNRPVITNFDIDLHYTIDWNAVSKAASANPDFIFQHSSGFTHPVSGGSYAWVIVNVTDYGMSYLSKFYQAGLAAAQEYTIGGAYKGFNDTLASWGSGRIMTQQCGQTWLQTFSRINSFYDSGKQLDAVQLVTWNDYEEGTEIETGIDNCFSVSAKISGSSLQWSTTGNENTIDHYVVYISTDGKNLMPLDTLQPGSRNLDLASYELPAGKYSAFVQAVGVPTMINHLSSAVGYTAAGVGSASASVPFSLGVSPVELSVAAGKSGTASLTVTATAGAMQSPVRLSCLNLPSGAVCSFLPVSVTPGNAPAASVVTISTGNAAAVLRQEFPGNRSKPGQSMLFSGLGVMAVAFSGTWSRRKILKRILGIAALGVMLVLLASCGGGGTTPAARTSPGVYAVTIQGDSGAQSSSTTVLLTVQ